jgi:hypothetical protein
MGASRWIGSVAVAVVAASSALVGAACTPPPPVVRVDDVRVPEQGGPAVFTITLSKAATGPVSVRHSTANGTATAPADYTATSGTLRFATGQTSRTVSVPVVNDTLDEDDETFRLDLSGPSGVTVGDGSGAGTVVDEDPPPTVTFRTRPIWGENEGTSGFPVDLSAPSGRRVEALFTTSDGAPGAAAATFPADYGRRSWLVTFAPGSTEAFVPVPVVNDTLDEDDESFTATLSSPLNVTLGSFVETYGTILDDDHPPSVIIDDALAQEREGELSFRVRLSAPSGRPTSVAYTTRSGTATANRDYAATSGTLRWTPGTTEGSVSVPIVWEGCQESSETLFLDLGRAEHVAVPDPSGLGTILDADFLIC